MSTAVLLMGHGSRAEKANNELREVAKGVFNRGSFDIVEAAFLQLTGPSIEEGVKKCAEGGAKKVYMVPYFLYIGIHVSHDLPEIIGKLRTEYPGIQFILTGHLGVHDRMADVVLERIRESD
ncbi:MAG: sirohydrochlorin chelatase [Nitrospinota bacterium]